MTSNGAARPPITVKYSCSQCGIVDREVELIQRRDDEDVKHWVKVTLVSHLVVNHRRHSPFCTATHMEHVKIPVFDETPVGRLK